MNARRLAGVAVLLVACDPPMVSNGAGGAGGGAAPLECLPEPADITLPEGAYEDEAACPQDVVGAPWELVCGRGYMTEIEQPDGSFPFVCVRARDCDCLEDWADCTGDDVPIPGYCAFQK